MATNPYEALVLRGETLFRQGEVETALELFEAVLEKDPENVAALNDAGLAAAELGRSGQSAEYLECALDLDPANEAAFFNLLDICIQRENVHLLKDTFSRYQGDIPETEEKREYRQRIYGNGRAADTVCRIKIVSFADFEKDQQNKKRWGDYWFKKDLESALSRYDSATIVNANPDVLIHLFGAPVTGLEALGEEVWKVLWIHSHPDWISPELLKKYDKIYCISPAFVKKLRSWGVDAEVLIGATSRDSNEGREEKEKEYKIVFVGNAKRNGRKIIRDIMQTPYTVSIWGNGWDGIVPESWIEGTYFPNARLDELYARSRIVLNDHHEDMRIEGFVSPRIFDALSAGAAVISDRVKDCPENIADLFEMYDSPDELEKIIEHRLNREPSEEEKNRRIRAMEPYTFPRIADRIAKDLNLVGEEGPCLGSTFERIHINDVHSRSVDEQGYLVMGMHRSGTSLITQLLHRAGIYAGATTDHIPPASDNPKGFWELKSLVELNKIILYLAGGSWQDPPSAHDIESISVGPRAEKVFDYFSTVPQWVAKDPRLCLTFPVLIPAIPKSTKIIVVKRSPEAIAKSLYERNGISLQEGQQLMETYLTRLDRYTRGFERVDVQFETLFSGEHQSTLRKLNRFVEPEQDLNDVFPYVIEPTLKHH